jgi:CubicO group peptidase (beta-lactamase class C family)
VGSVHGRLRRHRVRLVSEWCVWLLSIGAACVGAQTEPAVPASETGHAQRDRQTIDAALASSAADQRERALDEIIATRDARAELLPRIATLLDDADLPVAGKAATALSLRGTDAFPVIGELLKSGSTQQRWGATVALYHSSAAIERFVPALTHELADPDERVVRASLGVLTRLQAKAAPALPALKPLLAHEEPEIRWAALATLGAIGPPAQDAVPLIEPFLDDEAVELRLVAADALRRIQPPAPGSDRQLEADIAWIRQSVPRLMQKMHVPGVSIAIVQKGRIAWAQGFGVRDARDRVPVTTATVFEAASMSKPILALVAIQLIQEGRLDLDRPLVDYLGHDYLPDQPEQRRITARMALTHRTGLPNWRIGYSDLDGPLAVELPPGAEYTYSGEGILFLQRAIERITAQPLEQLSEDRLFAPLGLSHTSFNWTDAIETHLASGHHDDGSYKQRTRYRKANAAYSLYTTPTEYARLMLAVMTPEVLGPRALTRESTDLLLQRELRIDDDPVPRPGRARSVATYRALGWKVDVSAEGDIVWHSGSNSSGFKSYAQFNALKQSGIVIFANSDGGYPLREAVLKRIGDL